ncbi:hypothetical protein PC128_g23819 [Phytophthora cactorum]|nr:hypothetical protein PC128_g23819 [Phytophthora cactorum]
MCILNDGVYVCAAFSSLRVTHCFSTLVSNGEKVIYDYDKPGVPVDSCDRQWIVGIIFVRRICLYPKLKI